MIIIIIIITMIMMMMMMIVVVITFTIIIIIIIIITIIIIIIVIIIKGHRLGGLVVKAPASRAADLGLIPVSRFQLLFFKSSHTCDLKINVPSASLPAAWRYKVSAGTSSPGDSIL